MDELEALLVEFGILDDDTKHADIIGKPAGVSAK
jgi:nitrogenase iron protein NifH